MARGRTGATAKPRRLKVFEAQFGFFDSVVAAPSQAAALRAWGTHQNLFADGQARVTTEAAAVRAALSQPEVPLRRAVGTTGAFAVEPTALPSVPDPPTPAPRRSRKAAPSPRPRPDRSTLEAAERALAELDATRRQEERRLQERQAALEAEIAVAHEAHLDARKAAKAAVVAARAAYRKAGGED